MPRSTICLSREAERLDALHELNLLDTPPREAFDRITRMAAQLFQLPVAAVSLTDSDRQWFKSRVGVEHDSTRARKRPAARLRTRARCWSFPTCRPTRTIATARWPDPACASMRAQR